MISTDMTPKEVVLLAGFLAGIAVIGNGIYSIQLVVGDIVDKDDVDWEVLLPLYSNAFVIIIPGFIISGVFFVLLSMWRPLQNKGRLERMVSEYFPYFFGCLGGSIAATGIWLVVTYGGDVNELKGIAAYVAGGGLTLCGAIWAGSGMFGGRYFRSMIPSM